MDNRISKKLVKSDIAGSFLRAPMSPQDDADVRNQRLFERDPKRAGQIEWYVASDGSVQLKEKFDYVYEQYQANKARQERDRNEWMKANGYGR